MRILLCYYFRPDVPLGWNCLKALRALGHEVLPFECHLRTPFDTWVIRPANKLLSNLRFRRDQEFLMASRWSNLSTRSRRLLKAVRDFKPDAVVVMRGASLLPEVLQEVKRSGSPVLAYWWLKGPIKIYPDTLEEVRHCDLLLSTSRQAMERLGQSAGVRCCYLPLAVDPEIHRKLSVSPSDRRRYDCDIAYVGSWQKGRQEVIEHLLSHHPGPVKIWGPGWENRGAGNRRLRECVEGRGIYGEEVVKLFNVARMSLNIHTWHGIASGVNGLAYEVPACGGMVLLDHLEEVGEIYNLGEEVDTYRSLEELVDKVRFYLEHEEVRSRMAQRAYERVRRDHTFLRRMSQLVEAVSAAGKEVR